MTDSNRKAEETNVEYIERIIKEFERKGRQTKNYNPRRVGEPEREAHSEYIREAYSRGYLNDEELADRVKRAHEAKYASDLADLVDDLPSYAELRGVQAVPKKVRKWTFGIGKHPVIAAAVGLALGLIVAITPSATINTHFNSHSPSVLVPVMVVTIVVGVVAALFSFIRLIWLLVEAMD
jgi:hypothetical protein